MRRLISVGAVALVAVSIAGCSEDSSNVPQPTARLTVNDTNLTTHTIVCTQIESMLTIKVTAAPAVAQAILDLKGDGAVVRTVNLTNFDGFHGVAGEGTGQAAVTFADGTYTITGDAEGAVPDHPAESRTARFRIQAPC